MIPGYELSFGGGTLALEHDTSAILWNLHGPRRFHRQFRLGPVAVLHRPEYEGDFAHFLPSVFPWRDNPKPESIARTELQLGKKWRSVA